MSPSKQTNVEFITDVMEHSRQGPLMQAVIIEAVAKYAENVIARRDEVLKAMEQTMVHGPAWIACCEELKKRVDAKYGHA